MGKVSDSKSLASVTGIPNDIIQSSDKPLYPLQLIICTMFFWYKDDQKAHLEISSGSQGDWVSIVGDLLTCERQKVNLINGEWKLQRPAYSPIKSYLITLDKFLPLVSLCMCTARLTVCCSTCEAGRICALQPCYIYPMQYIMWWKRHEQICDIMRKKMQALEMYGRFSYCFRQQSAGLFVHFLTYSPNRSTSCLFSMILSNTQEITCHCISHQSLWSLWSVDPLLFLSRCLEIVHSFSLCCWFHFSVRY